MRKQPPHGAQTLFLDFQYINILKFEKTTYEKVNFNKFTGLQQDYFKTRKNLLQKGQFQVYIISLYTEILQQNFNFCRFVAVVNNELNLFLLTMLKSMFTFLPQCIFYRHKLKNRVYV